MAQHQLPAECSRLMGYAIPQSRPAPAQNQFVDLFSDDGKTLILRSEADARRLIHAGPAATLLNGCTLNFPVRIALNFPWCIGARPGVDIDSAMQEALAYQLNGLNNVLTLCDNIEDGTNDHAQKCAFSEGCSSVQMQRQNHQLVAVRIARQAEAVAPFSTPYLVNFWVKTDTQYYLDHGTNIQMERQTWGPWQFCTNCRAVRSVSFCEHWRNALVTDEFLRMRNVRRGEQSDMDLAYSGNGVITEWVLSQDKHTYG